MPRPPARLPGVDRRKRGRRRYTAVERRLLKPTPTTCARCGRRLKTPGATYGRACAVIVARELAELQTHMEVVSC